MDILTEQEALALVQDYVNARYANAHDWDIEFDDGVYSISCTAVKTVPEVLYGDRIVEEEQGRVVYLDFEVRGDEIIKK